MLVVGSGQSGCQIAEELRKSGRRVFLSIGTCGRAPRRYRGKDLFDWLELIRFLDRPPSALPSPKAKFAANPHVSGAGGGHDLNLHQFARDGITLLGHLRGATDERIGLALDLHDSLAKVDQFEAELLGRIDDAIARNGIDAPVEQRPALRYGYDQQQIAEVDIEAAGIGSVIWAAGYRFDFGLVKLPVTDGDGFPVQQRGVTACPGLYFVGMPWLYTQKSGLLAGVGDDAAFIADTYRHRQLRSTGNKPHMSLNTPLSNPSKSDAICGGTNNRAKNNHDTNRIYPQHVLSQRRTRPATCFRP